MTDAERKLLKRLAAITSGMLLGMGMTEQGLALLADLNAMEEEAKKDA